MRRIKSQACRDVKDFLHLRGLSGCAVSSLGRAVSTIRVSGWVNEVALKINKPHGPIRLREWY